eukprot:12149158-Karenia_brevis.AAC.1
MPPTNRVFSFASIQTRTAHPNYEIKTFNLFVCVVVPLFCCISGPVQSSKQSTDISREVDISSAHHI